MDTMRKFLVKFYMLSKSKQDMYVPRVGNAHNPRDQNFGKSAVPRCGGVLSP
jgi:hypothetical protein